MTSNRCRLTLLFSGGAPAIPCHRPMQLLVRRHGVSESGTRHYPRLIRAPCVTMLKQSLKRGLLVSLEMVRISS